MFKEQEKEEEEDQSGEISLGKREIINQIGKRLKP